MVQLLTVGKRKTKQAASCDTPFITSMFTAINILAKRWLDPELIRMDQLFIFSCSAATTCQQ
jgi:hypothetical protein